MDAETLTPVFDGHNDVLSRLAEKTTDDPVADFVNGDDRGHLDLPRMKKGGFAGGLFAVWIPSPFDEDLLGQMQGASYDVPLPDPVPQAEALPTAFHMISLLTRMEEQSGGDFRICRSAADIRSAVANDAVAAVLHFEGAEAIDPDFHALDVFYAAGLRSLGPVWSRPTIFGDGVPFRYPSSPDIGGGLTETGRALVRACNQRRIAIDLSHITEKGFWDVAAISDAPLIASHSNVHAICPHARNLTEKQLHAVRDSGGIVGLNFATQFLRPDGQRGANMSLDLMLRHLDAMIETMGVEHVGIGSDFDGAEVPADIGDATGLPRLMAAMRAHGYDEETMRLISHENWIRVLETTWGE
ncbi:MAG: peptidase [Hyphomicrobiales bacterium]|nr:MAG: peptidase [Hyphomicrobiales bacterium]